MADDWTIGTLKEYVDTRFRASETAINKAEDAATKRFEGLNELRAAMMDQQSNFASKESVAALNQRIDHLNNMIEGMIARSSGGGHMLTLMIAIAAVIVSVVVPVFFRR